MLRSYSVLLLLILFTELIFEHMSFWINSCVNKSLMSWRLLHNEERMLAVNSIFYNFSSMSQFLHGFNPLMPTAQSGNLSFWNR